LSDFFGSKALGGIKAALAFWRRQMQTSILATTAQEFDPINLLVKENRVTNTSIQGNKECFMAAPARSNSPRRVLICWSAI
jgi:hypothetical protein